MGNKELRKFGFILAAGFAIIFGTLIPFFSGKPVPQWPWLAGLFFITVALILPAALKPVYVVWMKIGHVLGWFNTRLILSVVFYVIFTPIGFILFVLRKDPMCRKISGDVQTYRINRVKLTRDRLEKPF